MLRATLVFLAATVASAAPAAQLSPIITPAAMAELRAHCSSDAYNLCSASDIAKASVGYYNDITVCFRRQRAQLSLACRATVAKYGLL